MTDRAAALAARSRSLAGAGDLRAAFEAALKAASIDADHVELCEAVLLRLVADGQKSRARRLVDAERLPGPLRKRLIGVLKGGRAAAPALRGDGPRELAALIRQGDLAGAVALSEHLLARGEDPDVLNLRGVIEMQRADPDAAETFFRRAVAARPGFHGAASNLGFALLLQGRAADAAETLEAVLADDPDNLDARTNLASARLRLDMPDVALVHADKVLAVRPTDDTAQRVRAQALRALGRAADALVALRGLESQLGAAFDLFAVTSRILEETDGAEAAIEYLAGWSDRSVPARLRRAILLAQTGDLEQAESEYRAVLAADPTQTEAFYLLALQGDLPASDPLVPRMREVSLRSDALSPTASAHLHYGLGKSLLDAGDPPGAFAEWVKANTAQLAGARDKSAELAGYLASIRAAWTSDRSRDYADVGVPGLAPIFVLGIQRSGSTLTEQILSAHPEVTGLGEQSMFYYGLRAAQDFSKPEFGATAQRLAADLRAASPTPRMVDKFLGNFRQLGAIASAFPDAVIVNPRRDPRSIALSVYQNRFDPETFSWTMRLEDIARYFLEYERHMAHWRAIFGARILDLHYEDLVGDPEPTVRGLLAHCRLEWDAACLRPDLVNRRVDTLSIGQVRQAIHTGSRVRWRRFERDLEPFTAILRDAGYPLPE